MNKVLLALSTAILFVACKKKEAEISCSDGIQNGIEYGVDCGGNCTPCSQANPSYAFLKVNGASLTASGYVITNQAGYYRLNLTNDSIELRMNIGDGTVGSMPMSAVGTSLVYKNQTFPVFVSGTYVITENNTSQEYMNGVFSATFADGSDTAKITGGQFNRVPY